MIPRQLGGRWFTPLFLGTLALAIGSAYWSSLAVGFHFDDLAGIARNPAIRSLENIPRFFVDPRALWIDVGDLDLRPFLLTTYALNYAVSGLEPWSYHALNLILHLVASALVFVIVRDHLWWPAEDRGPGRGAQIPAAVAALLFAVAPLNSQPVVYIWARSALLCTTLYLGAFLYCLRRRWLIGFVFLALALLTKAIAVTFPAVLFIYALVYRERSVSLGQWLRDWRRWGVPILLAGLLDAGYLAYRSQVLGFMAAKTGHAPWVTSWIWLVSQWSALVYYVRLFLWPDSLSMDPDFPVTTSLFALRAWGALLLLLSWIALALLAMGRYPHVAFATAWFFVTLAPESSFIPLGDQVINDHRPYIATSLGLAVLLAWALYETAARLVPRARNAVCLGACLLLCLPAIAFDRYRTWQWADTLRIWEDTVRKSPNNARAWMNGGRELMMKGNLADARRYFERGRDLAPDFYFPYMNLALLDAHEGRLAAALGSARHALELKPDDFRTHYHLGLVLERIGRTGQAMAAYRRALELNPIDPGSRAALAQLGGLDRASPDEEALMTAGFEALYLRRDVVTAAQKFRKVLELNPSHYGATNQLARCLDGAGRYAEARPLWEQVVMMAEGRKDYQTADAARARLAQGP